MRPPRVRFTVRRLMVAVAIAALLASAFLSAHPKVTRRRAECYGRARQHSASERMARTEMQTEARNLGSWAALAAERRLKAKGALPTVGEDMPPSGEESWASLAEQASAQSAWHARRIMVLHQEATYHADLRRNWEKAAAFPFLAADPPENPYR
jgi:hypothetical protein